MSATPVTQFIAHVDRYLQHDAMATFWLKPTRPTHRGEAEKLAEKGLHFKGLCCEERNAITKLGGQIAETMESQGFDSRELLALVNAADGGGGPSAFRPLWPSAKAMLQQYAIQSRLSTAVSAGSAVIVGHPIVDADAKVDAQTKSRKNSARELTKDNRELVQRFISHWKQEPRGTKALESADDFISEHSLTIQRTTLLKYCRLAGYPIKGRKK